MGSRSRRSSYCTSECASASLSRSKSRCLAAALTAAFASALAAAAAAATAAVPKPPLSDEVLASELAASGIPVVGDTGDGMEIGWILNWLMRDSAFGVGRTPGRTFRVPSKTK